MLSSKNCLLDSNLCRVKLVTKALNFRLILEEYEEGKYILGCDLKKRRDDIWKNMYECALYLGEHSFYALHISRIYEAS